MSNFTLSQNNCNIFLIISLEGIRKTLPAAKKAESVVPQRRIARKKPPHIEAALHCYLYTRAILRISAPFSFFSGFDPLIITSSSAVGCRVSRS